MERFPPPYCETPPPSYDETINTVEEDSDGDNEPLNSDNEPVGSIDTGSRLLDLLGSNSREKTVAIVVFSTILACGLYVLYKNKQKQLQNTWRPGIINRPLSSEFEFESTVEDLDESFN